LSRHFLLKTRIPTYMRHTKSIMITTAIVALVICISISFSGASQAITTHGVKAKHKHTVAKHRVQGKHPATAAQALAKPTAENEQEATAANDSLWFWRHRDLATGKIPAGLTNSWYQSDQAHALTRDGRDGALSTGDPLDTVASLGLFIQGGRTRAVLVSAADLSNNTFFAGGVSGGLWKSTNAGSNWAPINDTAANLAVTCITQSPFNSNNIYYGTGELRGWVPGENGGAGYPGGGVFKSTDGGNTFQQLSATASTSNFSWAIEQDKADSLTVYWATESAGLQRTTNGGTTWSTASGASGFFCDVVTFANGSVLAAKWQDGIYRASNGKTGSFTKISSPAFPSTYLARIKLAQCKNFPNIIYAAFAKDSTWGDGLSALCKSSDGGVTWDTVVNPSNLPSSLLGSTQGFYNMMLGVRATDSNSIVCGLQGGAYSFDGGTTWTRLVDPLDHHAFASYNSGSNHFLIGSDHGVTMLKWDSLAAYGGIVTINNNYATTQFVGGGFASSGRRCAGGTQDNSAWRISPDTVVEVAGADNDYCYIDQQDSNLAYVGPGPDEFTGFFTNSRHIYFNFPPIGGQGKNVYNFYQCNYADGLQAYYRTNAAIWRTTDTGHSWAQLNGSTISGIDYIGCTAVVNPTVYFTTNVSGQNDHFYRITSAKTFTAGGTPTDLSASIPSAVLTASFGEIAPLPSLSISTSLYMCTVNYSSIPHIYKVKNANTATPTWENLTGDLPSTLAVNEVQADPNDTNVLFAATDYGLYYSTNNGTNWIKEPRVPNTIISEMQLRASDSKLFLFTYGRGVWYCSIKSGLTGSVEQASVAPTATAPQLQFSLYPNPATEKLTINPQQTLSSSARIAIYSSDGRMISESAWNPTGEVNIGSLPSGAYFLQVQDGNLTAKNKFVKM
jgi:hypothetical protein